MTEQAAAQNQEQSKEAKLKKREQNLAAMQKLLDAYPEVFNLKSPRPLSIGIHEQIETSEEFSKTKIRRALATYVRQTAYLKCIAEDADRVNIKGEAEGKVNAEEAAHAKEQLQQRFKNKKPAQNKKPVKPKKPSAEQRFNNKLDQLLAVKGKAKQ